MSSLQRSELKCFQSEKSSGQWPFLSFGFLGSMATCVPFVLLTLPEEKRETFSFYNISDNRKKLVCGCNVKLVKSTTYSSLINNLLMLTMLLCVGPHKIRQATIIIFL